MHTLVRYVSINNAWIGGVAKPKSTQTMYWDTERIFRCPHFRVSQLEGVPNTMFVSVFLKSGHICPTCLFACSLEFGNSPCT